MGDQEFSQGMVLVLLGIGQGAIAVLIDQIDGRTMIDEKLGDLIKSVVGGIDQGRPTLLVLTFNWAPWETRILTSGRLL